MRSCPRCGATVGPDAQICPSCHAVLPAPTSSVNSASDGALPRSSETPSPDGLTPAQPSAETWGPGAWGPVGEIVDLYPPEPFSLPNASFSPPGEQPPPVREYATGMLRPNASYRPPARPEGARYPGYPIIPQSGQPAPTAPYPAYPSYP